MPVLLAFGDSNTHGTLPLRAIGDRRRHPPEVRWPGVAAAALGPTWQVVEEGHPGRTTLLDDPVEGAHKNGLAHLPVALESHRPVDVVSIMLGTNDLKRRYAHGPLDIALSVERLVRTVKGSDAGPGGAAPKVLLIAPVPITESGWLAPMFEGGAEKGRALAALLEEVAARQSVAFLDAGRHAETSPVDGVHMEAEAHAALGAAIAAAVAPLAG